LFPVQAKRKSTAKTRKFFLDTKLISNIIEDKNRLGIDVIPNLPMRTILRGHDSVCKRVRIRVAITPVEER
jgi:3-methyladenine DNA glycosylase Mpg